jgi:acetylornithine deacetylase
MLHIIPALSAMSFSGPARADYRGLRRVGVGVIRGGLGPEYHDWRPSLLADRCTIKFSARYSPGQTPEMVIDDIRALIARLQKADPDLIAAVRLNQGGQRMLMGPFEVAQDADIVQTVVRAHREVTGEVPKIGAIAPYKFYGTDAAHLSHAGMVGLVYGPGGKYNTMPDERVELRDLFTAARVYARVIVETCA